MASIITSVQVFTNSVNYLRALSLADEPASQQMLINYFNANNGLDNSIHNSWQAELKNVGYPNGDGVVPFRRVAISNGSECGTTEPFGPGENLLTFQGKANTRFLGDLAGTLLFFPFPLAGALLNQPALFLGAIPGRNDFNFDFRAYAQADGASNQVYTGKITYTKKVLWLIPITATITNRSYNSSASTLPYDYFPGGFYVPPINLQSSSYQNALIKYNLTGFNQPTFNFIPTPSALDVGQNATVLTKADYLARYVGATPPTGTKSTPFQNFITAFNAGSSNDEHHISFETRNGDWLANELSSTPTTANCSFICSNSMSITGPSIVCSTPLTYTLNNAPTGSGITIIWSASPSSAVSITPSANGSQAQVTKSSGGQFTLSVTVSSTPCGSLTISSPFMQAGGYGSSDYPVSGPSSGSCGSISIFQRRLYLVPPVIIGFGQGTGPHLARVLQIYQSRFLLESQAVIIRLEYG